jgi:undecaprenyl-diphosphatase
MFSALLLPPVAKVLLPVTLLSAMAAMAAAPAGPATVDLAAWHAVILGLVEGITEYLPISSTGHLLATSNLLDLGGTDAADDALETYAICIQSGAILAVLLLYRERVWQMVDGVIGRSEEGRRVVLALLAAFVPTAILAGVIFPIVQQSLFGGSIAPTAAAWLVGGVAILWLTRSGFLNRAGHELALLDPRRAAMIGLLQTIAIWPGVSRSLVTIVAGVLMGMNLKASVEFSFLLGVITLTAATVYEGIGGGANLIDQFGVVAPLIGLVVAFVAAVIAIRWMVTWLQQRSFAVFGWYRILIGMLAFVGLSAGWL